MYYIQCKSKHAPLETVDEFTSKKEADITLAEYVICDKTSSFYISTKPCKEWAASKKVKA